MARRTHKRAMRRADFNSSALAEHVHAWSKYHPVDWSGATVLSNPSNTHTRLTQEAIFIRTIESTLNRDIGSLSTEYNSILCILLVCPLFHLHVIRLWCQCLLCFQFIPLVFLDSHAFISSPCMPFIVSVYCTDDGSCIAAKTFVLSNFHSWLVYLSKILRLIL
jgi:hypothetical protein